MIGSRRPIASSVLLVAVACSLCVPPGQANAAVHRFGYSNNSSYPIYDVYYDTGVLGGTPYVQYGGMCTTGWSSVLRSETPYPPGYPLDKRIWIERRVGYFHTELIPPNIRVEQIKEAWIEVFIKKNVSATDDIAVCLCSYDDQSPNVPQTIWEGVGGIIAVVSAPTQQAWEQRRIAIDASMLKRNGVTSIAFRLLDESSDGSRAVGILDQVGLFVDYPEDPPLACFSCLPPSPGVREEITFDGSASFDPDGTIVSYEWDFGDGSGGAGAVVQHSYSQAGEYTVTLTVTDNDQLTGSMSLSVAVGQPPMASFEYSPTSPGVRQEITFDGSTSLDPDGRVVSYEWDFGDGSGGAGAVVQHSYSQAGGYTVTLTVTDNDQLTGSTSLSVEVGRPPVASFEYSPSSPVVREEITFNGSGSLDPDGTIVSYEWDFGDESTGAGPVVQHSYGQEGEYTVTLTATDNDQLTAAYQAVLRVKRIPCLVVVIPGVNTFGAKMVEGARDLCGSPCEVLQITEGGASEAAIRALVRDRSTTAKAQGRDMIVNVDMALDGVVRYIWPPEFTGWGRATDWAGKVANIVSEEFTKVVPGGRRVLYAHSAGGDAVAKSMRGGKRTNKDDEKTDTMYHDINILNGRTGADQLAKWLHECGYEWWQVKIFTSRWDTWDPNPTPWGKHGIANKDAVAEKARLGAWVHLHCLWVQVGDDRIWPGHNTLCDNWNSLAGFQVWTQTREAEPYTATFIEAMQRKWSAHQ
jgi:PKD repeat protein